MVPAQAGADGPFPEADHVLDERRLLEVRTIPCKRKSARRTRIKIGRIGYRVAEILVQERDVGFDARLPFLISVMYRDRALEISFAKPIVLKGDDRRGKRI